MFETGRCPRQHFAGGSTGHLHNKNRNGDICVITQGNIQARIAHNSKSTDKVKAANTFLSCGAHIFLYLSLIYLIYHVQYCSSLRQVRKFIFKGSLAGQ